MEIVDSSDPHIRKLRRIRRQNRRATIAAAIVLLVVSVVGVVVLGSFMPVQTHVFGGNRHLLLPVAGACSAAIWVHRKLESKEDPFDDD